MQENIPSSEQRRHVYRSLFWPVILIGAGVVWLLLNLGIISSEGLSVLFRLWPLILIVIGLDIIFGRHSPVLGALIGLGAVALVVAAMIIGPSRGWTGPARFFGMPVALGSGPIVTDQINEPLGEATSAEVRLDLSHWHTRVYPLSGSDNLIEAEITRYASQSPVFEVRGTGNRSVRLGLEDGFWFIGFDFISQDYQWAIGLSPEIPIALTVDVASGRATLDLNGLELTDLTVDGGSGSVELTLPAASRRYAAAIDIGSGSFQINMPAGAQVDMNISGGSGSLNAAIAAGASANMEVEGGSGSMVFDVPDNAAVRVIVVNSGSGSVNISGLQQVDDGGDDDNDTGTWETANFSSAADPIIITFEDIGSGSVTVH
jgi:hypothetical protein